MNAEDDSRHAQCFANPDFRFVTTLEYPVFLVPQEDVMRSRRRWIRSILVPSATCLRISFRRPRDQKKRRLWGREWIRSRISYMPLASILHVDKFFIEGFSFYSISIVCNDSRAVGLSLATLFFVSFLARAPLGMVGATILARGT